ncbi:SAVED domain-containing protein [Desulfosudis oleivorans]|uniref:HNH endonuclease n=1 Tax=Desulfosudis oleivorans (strain DSM 6200 / JCM 39069 / Hxd3) TaxID=96561 RepID=A8ZTV9_DESOH|nr:SAVED domain-containing protein [Desulfosudis oleivorans]ABW67892.1 conserved hypothetical protein [Desulfosudis oleivorans Hxd3]
MPKEVTRYIKKEVERELWARAAGRCQFAGCNRLLYKSPVTQENVNISEKAHIYAFSERGPRGWGQFSFNRKLLNDVSNLMLMCHDCHKTIDQDKGGKKYSAELLIGWKNEHEKRVAIVTGVNPEKKSHVILYGANIGEQKSSLQPEEAKAALFPLKYPAEEKTINLSMKWEGKDDEKGYWDTESKNLRDAFQRKLIPLIETADPYHLSVFAIAPMPLLTLLGSLLNDKVPVDVYQRRREPHPTWQWADTPKNFDFLIKPPNTFLHPPALLLSLSDSIAHDRVTSVTGKDISIWEVTIEKPGNDFLTSREQLSIYRRTVRSLLVDIGKAHGKATPLSIFPAMPVACAVELGRVRMPKADSKWIVYDQNNLKKKFIKALEIT